jgi:hypothetical protein
MKKQDTDLIIRRKTAFERGLQQPQTETVHVAAEYRNLVQECRRCGCILIDNRNTTFLESQGPPRAWAIGAVIVCGEAGDSRAAKSEASYQLEPQQKWCLDPRAS